MRALLSGLPLILAARAGESSVGWKDATTGWGCKDFGIAPSECLANPEATRNCPDECARADEYIQQLARSHLKGFFPQLQVNRMETAAQEMFPLVDRRRLVTDRCQQSSL